MWLSARDAARDGERNSIHGATAKRAENGCMPSDPALLPNLEPASKQGGSTRVQPDHSPLVACAMLDDHRSSIEITVIRSRNAKTSPMRRPLRHARAIIAPFRMPVSARLEHARMSASGSWWLERPHQAGGEMRQVVRRAEPQPYGHVGINQARGPTFVRGAELVERSVISHRLE